MDNNLNSHLEQISQLVNKLKKEGVDLDKINELDQSLELLNQRIKTIKLEANPEIHIRPHLNQDASVFFDENLKVIRYTGTITSILGRRKGDKFPELAEILDESSYMLLRSKTDELLETNKQQEFDAKLYSKNNLLLPVHIFLEKIKVSGQNMIAAGLIFPGPNPEDLKDYQEILIENLPGMDVFLFDTSFRHVLSGGQEKERFKLSNNDFAGKTLFEVYDEQTQKRLYPFYRNAIEGKPAEGEVRISDQIYYISSTPVIDLNNNVAGGALIAHNITREKEVEIKLIKAKREAEEGDKAKSLFLAKMSHEIRTPLNSIIGFTDLLNNTRLTAKQRKYGQLINQSSEHLLDVVNEILFLFKLNMGKVYVEKKQFNIHNLVKNVHESLQMRATGKDLDFYFQIGSDVPKLLVGDIFRMKQILMNLAANAIKFTDEGEVKIQVTVEKENNQKIFLRFDIIDTGLGINKEDLDKIFDEFAQAELNTEKSRKGVGLGLTISKKLVELLNGRMHVKSELQKGSVFSVIIPFEIPEAEEIIEHEKEYDISFNLLQGKKVFYADDDQNNVLLAESIFTAWGAEYEIAKDGAEALDMLKEKKYDIVLLDIHMPRFTGIQVAKIVRQTPGHLNQDTKMMAVTANILRSDIRLYLDNGFDDYLLKPFREKNFYSKICNLLNLNAGIQLKTEPEIVAPEKSSEINFDTTSLKKYSSDNYVFYNQMLDTFIDNTQKVVETFEDGLAKGLWNAVGETAHKAIPSFKYFELNGVVKKLAKLENLILREKKFQHVPDLISDLLVDLKKVVLLADDARLKDTAK